MAKKKDSKIELGARVLLGLMFVVFGANGLLMAFTGKGFMPSPPLNDVMMTIFTGFAATKYMFPLVSAMQALSGLFLLAGRYVNLAVTMLAPIIVNIVAIHLFVDMAGMPIAIVVFVLFAVIVKSRWQYFKPLFSQN